MKNIFLLTGIFFCAFTVTCHRPQQAITNNNNNDLIDSLISVKHINDKTILIYFGFDAVTAIKTQEGIIVIDAGISTGLTLKYRMIIENEFQSNAFRYVINTHFHNDHYRGNSVFEEAEVIGHENGDKEILEQWKDSERILNSLSKIVNEYEMKLQEYRKNTNEWYETFTQKTRYYCALNDAERQISVRQPDITFTDSLKVDMGEIEVEMIYFGACHSKSDILIYIPQLKILFTGDLFFKYGRPGITNEPDKEKWKRATKWIAWRIQNIETIISGHGETLSIEDLKSFNSKIIEICSN